MYCILPYLLLFICFAAYEVLSNNEKRKQYDSMGHAAYEENASNGGAGDAGTNFDNFSFDEVFKKFFPGGNSGAGGFGNFGFDDDLFGHGNNFDSFHQEFHKKAHEKAHDPHFGSFDSFFGNEGPSVFTQMNDGFATFKATPNSGSYQTPCRLQLWVNIDIRSQNEYCTVYMYFHFATNLQSQMQNKILLHSSCQK